MNPRTVTIFGVFDGIHDGHMAFIKEAKNYGDRLIAIVARDSVVENIKGHNPKINEANRIHNLSQILDIDMVLLGDLEQGTYKVIKEVKPDIIFLGYDQKDLGDDLNTAIKNGVLPKIEIIYGEAYKPKEFKSSIINKKNELGN